MQKRNKEAPECKKIEKGNQRRSSNHIMTIIEGFGNPLKMNESN